MLTEKMNQVLNEQINAEMFSSYFYLSMTAWFESQGLSGFANWMRLQTEEETGHSEKIFNYILERGGKIELAAIDKPESVWESPLAVFEDVMEHEQKVTAMVNNLVDCALEERDHASNNFLQWFVAEQVEEEANVGAVLDRLKLIKNDSAGLFSMDLEMAKRTASPAE